MTHLWEEGSDLSWEEANTVSLDGGAAFTEPSSNSPWQKRAKATRRRPKPAKTEPRDPAVDVLIAQTWASIGYSWAGRLK